MAKVSVILPAYHSDATLRDCLRALRRQSFRDFEIILVNSSREQATAAIAGEFPEVRFIQNPTRLLPHAARNRGVEHASGELLVFSDPDCIPRPDWLTYLVESWNRGHLVVGGAMGLTGSSWFERAVHICKFHPLLEGQAAGPRWILPTANAAYSRQAWSQLGPFEGQVFAADAILSWRARAAGFDAWLDPRAVVEHHHGGNVSRFIRERLMRGVEFGEVRAVYEQWSRPRIIASIFATPLLVSWALLRAARDTAKSGWLGSYLSTFPIQIAGHASWAAGEAKGYWKALANPASSADHPRGGSRTGEL